MPPSVCKLFFCCHFHNLEAQGSLCASCDLKFQRGSTVTNYFKFSLAGTLTVVLYTLESPWASLCPCANTFCVRGVASGRPRRASKRLDCRLWKHATSCINTIEREKLSWSRQAGTRSYFWVRFWHLKTDMIFGDGVGASLVPFSALRQSPSHSGNSWSIKLLKNCESHWCVPLTAIFSKRRKIAVLWSERCDDIAAQGSLPLVMHLCFCLLTPLLHRTSMDARL